VQRDRLFRERDRRFRQIAKSVTFDRNGRSRSAKTAGHVQTESAVNFARNTHGQVSFFDAPFDAAFEALFDLRLEQAPEPREPILMWLGFLERLLERTAHLGEA